MKNTAIEWADNTINFYVGCTKVSEGCKNCYMYRLETRFGRDPTKVRKTNWKTIESNLNKWESSIIFVNSMSDTFHESLSTDDIWSMFRMMQFYQKHTFIVLTKRITRARLMVWSHDISIPDNVWIGTSVESQNHVDRIEELKQIPSKTKFVSFEPLLGKIECDLNGIDWAIIGGESDWHPRPMKAEWVDSLFNTCKVMGVKFFFKQWGGSTKCKCHKAWGCRLYKEQTWDERPLMKQEISLEQQ